MPTKDDKLAASFGALLKKLRTEAGLTQGEVAARADPPMQKAAVARYESGTRAPTLALLYQLARCIGCKPCDLLPDGMELPDAKKPKKGKKDR